MALKKELRAEYLAKRAALTDEEYVQVNQALLAQFKTLDFSGVNHLHVFLPLYKRREPDTTALITWLQQQHPQIKLTYPRADMDTCNLTSYLQDEHLVLKANSWGIIEPIDGTLVSPAVIDLVIIPLLAFDKQGYRVGYGKGFYDRFLNECGADTQFVGISQFPPVNVIDDVNAHDIKLHKCLMPGGIWRNPEH